MTALTDPTRETVFEDTTVYNMARVAGSTGGNVQKDDVAVITRTVFDLNSTAPTVAISSTTLASTGCIFNTLQTDSRWSVDDTGYNFRDRVSSTIYATGDHLYETWYRFQSSTSSTGDSYQVGPFELYVKKVRGST